MILGLTEAGAVPQPIAVAFSSEVDEVPNSSQRFAEWQDRTSDTAFTAKSFSS